jgi:hypothetical protein
MNAGEIAGAIGSVLGGIVGAGGAVAAVYLLIGKQRREDAARIRDAIYIEIIAFSKMATAALQICEHVQGGKIVIAKKNARSIMMHVDPIIYKAVADRIGLLPQPQGVVEFYMRVLEVQEGLRVIVQGPDDDNAPVPAANAETIAKSLITACKLARSIILHVPGSSVDERISQITLTNIEAALESAKRHFPNVASLRQ